MKGPSNPYETGFVDNNVLGGEVVRKLEEHEVVGVGVIGIATTKTGEILLSWNDGLSGRASAPSESLSSGPFPIGKVGH